MHNLRVAFLIPCYNEEVSVADVVTTCQKVIPTANVYVYDNNSTDKTVEKAQNAGAIVRREVHQGKGNVVRRMFADIDADVYVMTDGDLTYDIASVPKMIEHLISNQLDMVTGVRKSQETDRYPKGHRFGNKLMTGLVSLFFKNNTADMLSGLRVFSKRFVKSFPAASKGFEIETELTVFALSERLPIADIDTPYYARPTGSTSKLSTIKDGYKILKMITFLVKEERPLLFFGLAAAFLFLLGILTAIPVVLYYLETGLVPRFPTVILSVGLIISAAVSLSIALILDSGVKTRKENRRFVYLSYPTLKE